MWSWLFGKPSLHDPSLVRVTGTIREHMVGDETITVDIEIENTQPRKSVAAFIVTLTESKYWHLKRVLFSSGLAPLSTSRETVELTCKAGVSRFDAEKHIKALIYHENANEKDGREEFFPWRQKMPTPFPDYAAEMPPDMPMTILLIGKSGAGKTALLRNLLTAGSRSRDISKAGTVASFGKSVTHTLEYYSMAELRNVQVADVFGYAPSSAVAGTECRKEDQVVQKLWQQPELLALMQGMLPGGWSIRDKIAFEKRPALLDGLARRHHIPTSFIYVLDAREVDNEWYIKKEAALYEKLTQTAGFEGLICITHIDLLVPEAREFPLATYSEVEELKIKAADGMGAPRNTVYTVVAYDSLTQNERNYDIDRCSGLLLEASMKQSLQFARFHLDKRLRDFKDTSC